MQTMNISPDALTADTYNPRRTHDDKTIKALAERIKAQGVLSPLIVRPLTPDGAAPAEGVVSLRYSVICGSRRLAAAKLLGLHELPCTSQSYTDLEAAELGLSEQGAHEDLHYLERAEAYARWRDLGTTIALIATKEGLSKSTVHAIVAMEKLTPESKRACWDGKLEESTARELATVAGSAQGRVLRKLMEPSPNGGKKSVRECREDIASFRIDLTKAPFDPKDTSLICLEHKGDCGSCPFRTGSQPELFSEVKNDWLCTNPDGYAKKAEIAWLAAVDDGEHNRGPKCLLAKQSDKWFDPAGNVRDDAPFVDRSAECHQDTAQRPYSLLVPKAAPYFLARSPKTGAFVGLIDREALKQQLEDGGKIRRVPSASPRAGSADEDDDEKKLSAEDAKAKREKVKLRQAAIRRLVAAVVAKMEKRDPDKKWFRMMAEGLFYQDVLRQTLLRRDVQETPSKYLDRLNEGQLRAFVFEGSMEFELYGESDGDKWPARLKEAAAWAGVDTKEIENETFAAARAEPTVKKAVTPTKPKGEKK